MDPQELVPIFRPEDYLQADAIRQALVAENIPCLLEGENLASWEGGGFIGDAGRCYMRLMVRSADADHARQIIEQGEWPTYT